MTNALALIAVLVLGLDGADKPGDDLAAIQGVWRGTGRYAHVTLIFCGHTLLGINERVGDDRWGVMKSIFTLGPDDQDIDIERPDGEQLGRYVVKGDRLSLRLGELARARPKPIEPIETPEPSHGRKRDPASPPFRYVLERAK